MPVTSVIELLGRGAEYNRGVMQELTNESLEIVEDFENQRLRRTTERVAHSILFHARRKRAPGGSSSHSTSGCSPPTSVWRLSTFRAVLRHWPRPE